MQGHSANFCTLNSILGIFWWSCFYCFGNYLDHGSEYLGQGVEGESSEAFILSATKNLSQISDREVLLRCQNIYAMGLKISLKRGKKFWGSSGNGISHGDGDRFILCQGFGADKIK